ncbi:hypothetical protein [Wolbachia endosymbiont of Wuchereria bancrofti]|uniref:hypothetical protein n=1 Tax=Wolbachia endosymbiont of Wuchereria bancrofti TaxID=96496 RepID=UPI000B4C7F71|nr:hypothetical protein [Wolbachia endosymbiont of Wuchereria bancrofti]
MKITIEQQTVSTITKKTATNTGTIPTNNLASHENDKDSLDTVTVKHDCIPTTSQLIIPKLLIRQLVKIVKEFLKNMKIA